MLESAGMLHAADDLALARDTIDRQADEIACLRQLVHTLAQQPGESAAVPSTKSSSAECDLAGAQLPDPFASFAADELPRVDRISWLDDVTPGWAWNGSTGRGVRVAVIDSGISARHPAIGGRVDGYLAIREGSDGLIFDPSPHDDEHGHGTACASLIRALAPECELYSVKVLGARLEGPGRAFVAALRWAIDHGIQVCNLSLGTSRPELYGPLHQLADEAYVRNMHVVAAASHGSQPGFPASFASVISVAAIRGADPYRFYYCPGSPVEFRAAGIGVRVAWPKRRWRTETGNSFAAPQVTGIVARTLARHPGLAPSQTKALLRALSANVGDQAE